MKFIQLQYMWVNLSQIKYIIETSRGLDLHFSTENPTEKMTILEDGAKILMQALDSFNVKHSASN